MSISVKVTASDKSVTVTLKDADKDIVLASQEIAPTMSHEFFVDDGVAISAVDADGQETDIDLS